MEEGERGVAVGGIWEGGGPGFGEVVGVDGEVTESGGEAVVEGVGDEGTVEDGDEWFGEGGGHGAEAGAQAGTEEESLTHRWTLYSRLAGGNRESEKLGDRWWKNSWGDCVKTPVFCRQTTNLRILLVSLSCALPLLALPPDSRSTPFRSRLTWNIRQH